MLSIKHNISVYIAVGVTDMRKSINGLSLLVQEEFELDLFAGSQQPPKPTCILE